MVAGFANAPLTKFLLILTSLLSVLCSLCELQPYLHLQLHPHLSVHHQYYRLFTQHLAFTNSSELFLSLLLLYNVGIKAERLFGTRKFASFLAVTTLIYTGLQLVVLAAISKVLSYVDEAQGASRKEGVEEGWLRAGRLPAGPWGMVFSILHQYSLHIPHLWSIQVADFTFTDQHITTYSLALLLSLSQPPSSLLSASLGILASLIYSSSRPLQAYRLPLRLHRLLSHLFCPFIGSTRLPQRSWRVETPPRRTLAAREARLAEHSSAVASIRGEGGLRLASFLRRRTGQQGAGVAVQGSPIPVPVVRGDDVPRIRGMEGFDRGEIRDAIRGAGGDVEAAIARLHSRRTELPPSS